MFEEIADVEDQSQNAQDFDSTLPSCSPVNNSSQSDQQQTGNTISCPVTSGNNKDDVSKFSYHCYRVLRVTVKSQNNFSSVCSK